MTYSKIYLDFETRSEVDLKKVGAWVYSMHPTTSILCIGVAPNDTPALVYTNPSDWDEGLMLMLGSPNTRIIAHNSFFEYCIYKNILEKKFGFPKIGIDRWECTMSRALAMALPAGLDKLAKALGIPAKLDSPLLQLCKPRKSSKTNPDKFFEPNKYPDKFKALYEYCKRDVEITRELDKKLKPLTDKERQIWILDQKVNLRGVQIDVNSATIAIDTIKKYEDKLLKELLQLTGGRITSAKQAVALKNFLNEKGLEMGGVSAEEIEKALGHVTDPKLRRVLEIRKALGRSSVAKFSRMIECSDTSNRSRGNLIYHGAATGRWTGKNIQMHNLYKTTIKDPDTCIKILNLKDYDMFEDLYPEVLGSLASCLRGMLIAGGGKKLLCVDFSAIEARVLAWLADEKPLLNGFRKGDDVYKSMAGVIYHKDPEEVTKAERQLGKQAILGCGYGMGGVKFYNTCLGYSIELTEDFAKDVVSMYRSTYTSITRFWKQIEATAISCVLYDKSFILHSLKFYMNNGFLWIQLPSGRCLGYPYPEVIKEENWGTNKLTYKRVNATTKQWETTDTYGGALTENVVQAIARDIMAEAMLRCEAKGYPIVLTVHDEIISETNKDLKTFIEIIEQVPSWCVGPPITAEGYESVRYRK